MEPYASDSVDVLKPVVAGQFYPSDPEELSRDIQRYLHEADVEPAQKTVVAALSPHAGYVFSGPVAGFTFKHVQEQNPDTVLFVALSHRYPIDGGCVFAGECFETPLGRVSVDSELAQNLIERGRPIYADSTPYLSEHSVEVNLPFVQTVFPNARVVSVLISRADDETCRDIGRKIARAIKDYPNKKVLTIVSSDMSHYPSYDVANRIDREMLESLESLDPERISKDLQRLGSDAAKNVHCVMCGGSAMLTAVEAARELGARSAKTLCYRNSGDTSHGDGHRVVGYGSLAIYGASEEMDDGDKDSQSNEPEFELTVEDRKTLLRIARESVYHVLNKNHYEPEIENPHLKVKCGIFVTLKNGGQLRGCLGRFEAGDITLDHLTAVMAAQSASHDIRFHPVTLDELSSVDVQISVLTPCERVEDIGEIEIGKHGLQIQGRNSFGVMRSGTLLPQVATEQRWDVHAFLDATCAKAGLDADAWKDPQTVIWKYSAVVFGDLDFGSPPYDDPV